MKGSLLIAVFLILGTLVLSPISRAVLGAAMYLKAQTQLQIGHSKLNCAKGSNVYVINGDFTAATYDQVVVAYFQGAFYHRWYLLSESIYPIALTRKNENTIVLKGSGAPLVHKLMYQALRPESESLSKGDTIKRDGLQVIVQETVDGIPMEAEFTIPNAADSKNACLLYYSEGMFKPYTLPQIGETDTIKTLTPI